MKDVQAKDFDANAILNKFKHKMVLSARGGISDPKNLLRTVIDVEPHSTRIDYTGSVFVVHTWATDDKWGLFSTSEWNGFEEHTLMANTEKDLAELREKLAAIGFVDSAARAAEKRKEIANVRLAKIKERQIEVGKKYKLFGTKTEVIVTEISKTGIITCKDSYGSLHRKVPGSLK